MGRCLARDVGRGARMLGLGLLLFATACATAPGPRGSAGAYRQRAAVAGEESADGTQPWQEPAEDSGAQTRVRPLLYRHAGQMRLPDLALMLEMQRQWAQEDREPLAAAGCGPVPEGWPEETDDDQELLAPFLACPSVGDFLALQRGVDMAHVVERLEDWSAVRLGALGPLADARASRVLTGKRASFLLEATQNYGASAQVFALFIVHTAFDDELDALLRLLAQDKQLQQTLGPMEAVRQELERRGLKLTDYPERGERASDVLRGLRRAAVDALNSAPGSDGGRGSGMTARLQQLPPAYQEAVLELQRELMREHFAPGNAALGAFDQMTFGVPLGFYHLGEGTAHWGS